MLGDTAVAVNANDERYRERVGHKIILPLLNRAIPVVADDFVDPKFGTGAVKVTPAHDANDFEIAQRHNLPHIEVIDEEGQMTAEAGPYQGLDRYAARDAVLHDLREGGLLEKTEDYALSVGACQRCKTVIEPRLSAQWFMKMQPLAAPAIRTVEDGRIRIVPDNYRKIYLDWMNNIHDWCISRQLWWGHRIPVWYCAGISFLASRRLRGYTCLPPVWPSAHNIFPQMVLLAPFRPSGVLKTNALPASGSVFSDTAACRGSLRINFSAAKAELPRGHWQPSNPPHHRRKQPPCQMALRQQ